MPKEPKSVSYLGIKYSAPIDKKAHVIAFNEKTGKKLFEKRIYEETINPEMEEDVQWIFINNLKIKNNHLLIKNTNNEIYSMDLSKKDNPVKRIK